MYATQDITSSPYLEVFMCKKKLKTKVSEKPEQALGCFFTQNFTCFFMCHWCTMELCTSPRSLPLSELFKPELYLEWRLQNSISNIGEYRTFSYRIDLKNWYRLNLIVNDQLITAQGLSWEQDLTLLYVLFPFFVFSIEFSFQIQFPSLLQYKFSLLSLETVVYQNLMKFWTPKVRFRTTCEHWCRNRFEVAFVILPLITLSLFRRSVKGWES